MKNKDIIILVLKNTLISILDLLLFQREQDDS